MKPVICLETIRVFQILAPQFYQIPILIYHSIEEGSRIDAMPLSLFKRHMEFFRKNCYKAISLYDTVELIKKRQMVSSPVVSLTFDDGYVDSFNLVYPILKKYNFPAAVFIVTDRIGKDGYLNFDQMRQMLKDGLVTFGSHTANHADLLRVDTKELLYEIEGSKKKLEDNLECKIDLFSYPWGIFSVRIQEIVKQAGYQAAFSTNSKIDDGLRTQDAYALRRVTMSAGDNYLRFLLKVSGFATCFARRINSTDMGVSLGGRG